MTSFERRTDHEEVALSRRAMPFQIPSVGAILGPLAEEAARLESECWAVFDSRFLDLAEGHALRMLGALFGEGLLEDSSGEAGLRYRIRLKIRALQSLGLRSDYEALAAILYEIPPFFTQSTWDIAEAPGWVLLTQNDSAFLQVPSVGISSVRWLASIFSLASADGFRVDMTHVAINGSVSFQWPSADEDLEGHEWPSDDGTITGQPWPGVYVA